MTARDRHAYNDLLRHRDRLLRECGENHQTIADLKRELEQARETIVRLSPRRNWFWRLLGL